MPEQEFHIYGESERACQKELKDLQQLENVKYFGKYDSFAQVAAKQKYAAFLYTSQYDGLPNVLIEAISNGLPSIPFDVGGIGELVHPDVLLSEEADFEENLAKIKRVLNDKTVLKQAWQYSRDILENRHSWQNFMTVLENIDGYFPKIPQQQYKQKYRNFRSLSRPLSKSH